MIILKRWAPIAALSVIVLGLAWLAYSKLGNTSASLLIVEPPSFDFGVVSAPVETTFALRNAGGAPLEILGVSTSCGCTRAWTEETVLAPGAQTTLHVAFDPTIHEGLVGEVLRQVYVRSNAPQQPEMTLELLATVVAPKEEAP